MKKKTFSTELAYLLGILALAIGTALMERANFGVSMVVAPAYLIYLKLSTVWSFVSFGMAEYAFQALLLLMMMLVLRRFHLSYLFSFVTAVLYGFVLDGCMALAAILPAEMFVWRAGMYIFGLIFCSVGVALMFETYIAPEVYELFVRELSRAKNLSIPRVKTVYDCVSCALAVILSFVFFGWMHFVGVRWGTVICALINGSMIGWTSRLLKRAFRFEDKLPLKRYFEA